MIDNPDVSILIVCNSPQNLTVEIKQHTELELGEGAACLVSAAKACIGRLFEIGERYPDIGKFATAELQRWMREGMPRQKPN